MYEMWLFIDAAAANLTWEDADDGDDDDDDYDDDSKMLQRYH